MCGRAHCALDPNALSRACTASCGGKDDVKWKGGTGKYRPSYNMGPGQIGAVMVADVNTDRTLRRCLQPMKWGLVPSWHRGAPTSFKMNMINARKDTLMDKASFRTPLKKGQRCVIPLEGFYEWERDHQEKLIQPYHLHLTENATGNNDTPLLMMAGLYDMVKVKREEIDKYETVFTYTIITVPAHSSIEWLHSRMPAILHTKDLVDQWLNAKDYPSEAMLDKLQPFAGLSWHPVTSAVGNIRYNDSSCIQKVKCKKEDTAKSANAMAKWLKTGTLSPKKATDAPIKADKKASHKRKLCSDKTSAIHKSLKTGDLAKGQRSDTDHKVNLAETVNRGDQSEAETVNRGDQSEANVDCPKCSFTNLEGSTICAVCTNELPVAGIVCPSCSFLNPLNEALCKVCNLIFD